MATKIDIEVILKSHDALSACSKLSKVAMEFAVLGNLDTARDLVSLLNEYYPCYHHHRTYLQPLWFAWDVTYWPTGEKKRVTDSMEEWTWSNSKSWRDFHAYTFKENGKFLVTLEEDNDDRQKLQLIKQNLRKVKEMQPADDGLDLVLAKSLEVVLAANEADESEVRDLLDDLFDEIAKRLHTRYQSTYVASVRSVWPLLMKGALARAAGIEDAKEKKAGRLAVKTFKQRFQDGPRRSLLWSKSIAELLRTISDNTVASEGAHNYWAKARMKETEWPTNLLKDGLPAEQITSLERRLGVSLPQDYKEFLSCSNGLASSWSGIIMDPPLFEASKVNWTTENDEYFTGLGADLINLQGALDGEMKFEDEGIGNGWPKVGQVVQIGSEGIDNVWLLPPARVKRLRKAYAEIMEIHDDARRSLQTAIKDFAGSLEEFENVEWCVLTWVSGGVASMYGFPSFKAFLVEKAEKSRTNMYPK